MQDATNLVVERRDEKPVPMNAFDLISTSQGLNLGTLFEKQMVTCISKIFIFVHFINILICSVELKNCSSEKNTSVFCSFLISLIFLAASFMSIFAICRPSISSKIKYDSNYFQGLVKRETRFTSKLPANEILSKIEEAAKPLGFEARKQNYKVSSS